MRINDGSRLLIGWILSSSSSSIGLRSDIWSWLWLRLLALHNLEKLLDDLSQVSVVVEQGEGLLGVLV